MHINGAWATEVKAHFNQGNVPFELTIKAETEITVLDSNDDAEDQSINTDPVEIAIEDSEDYLNKLVGKV